MPPISNRLKGALIAAFGIVCVSPDAMLMRLIVQKTGASNQLVVFWKSLSKIVGILTLISWSKGWRAALEGARRGPRFLLAASAVQACIDLGFTNMILLTSVARAMLFYSLNPLYAAVLGRLFLRDTLEWRTVAALLAAGVAIVLIFIPEIAADSSNGNDEETAQSDVGDVIAVFTGFSLATYICCVRAAHQHDPDIYMMPAASGGSLIAASIAAMSLATGLFNHNSGTDDDPTNHSPFFPQQSPALFFFLIFVDGLCVAIMLVCLTLAPRFCSAAEVSLITLLETPLGPLLVFAVLGEQPGKWTAIGGVLLLCTLVAHELKSVGTADPSSEKQDEEEAKLSVSLDQQGRGAAHGSSEAPRSSSDDAEDWRREAGMVELSGVVSEIIPGFHSKQTNKQTVAVSEPVPSTI